MRQYQVPQFITVEDKVIGPLTIKQFLFLLGGGAIIFLGRTFLVSFLFFPFALIIGTAAGALAFLKINERPFPMIVKNALLYFLRPRLYVWKKTEVRPKSPEQKKAATPEIRTIPRLTESKLTDLAWSLDVKSKHDQL